MPRRSIHTGDYKLFLQMLRAAREAAGVNQTSLAKRLGVTQSALSKYERGELRLDVVQTRRWCSALRLSFAAFMAEFDRQANR